MDSGTAEIVWTKDPIFAEEVGDASFATFYFYTEDGKIHNSGNIPNEYDVNRMMSKKSLYELMQINKRFITSKTKKNILRIKKLVLSYLN